ncbi:MAG: type IV pilus twitching motility protein PilT [Clostridia bacterium]|nr:type IV pilus twitching motility protein PilT [Clostridia bacterium]
MNIEKLLVEAAEKNASDVHVTVGIPPTMRLYGKLMPMTDTIVTKEHCEEIFNQILTDGQKNYLKSHGEFDLALTAQGNRFRLNVYKVGEAYSFAFRYLNDRILSFEALGLPRTIRSLCQLNSGLILVTGPTGMGKTTTLSSMIDWMNNNRDAHIVTLEDPIEYIHHHNKCIINQREIGSDSNSFAEGLRSALRQDPDIIFVGEMRDLESIAIALTAAETGHLVLSTLHTIGAAKTIDRIIDVFPPHQQAQVKTQLSIVLNAIISQQLLPCTDGTRVLAYEVMQSTPAIRTLIREGKAFQIPNIIRTNSKDGMITMDKHLLTLHKRGKISKSTVITHCIEREDILQYFGE